MFKQFVTFGKVLTNKTSYDVWRNIINKTLRTSHSMRCVSSNTRNCLAGAKTAQSDHAPVDRPLLANLKERGLYPHQLVRHVKCLKVKETTIEDAGKNVKIIWDDGHVSRFHSLWLRHCCHCEECKLDHNGMLQVNFFDIEEHTVVKSLDFEGDEVVCFTWQTGDAEHKGLIPTYWLRHYCYSQEADNERRKQRAMTFYKEKTIPCVEYEEVVETEQGLYKWLINLNERGICLVKNVPPELGMVAKVAERIGPLQHSIYGEIFDVSSTPEPINAAYSPVRLDLHMDQPHYESIPGIQMLHCLQFDENVIGGESFYVDIHEMAHKFRDERPDLFDILARVPVDMQTVDYARSEPVHIRTKRPIMNLNHKYELVSIVWHPMLIGPLQVDEADVEPFYKAYTQFWRLVNSQKEDLYKHRLVSGDLMSFLNRRILHGRAAYFGETGNRLLQGTYIEISEFLSKVQTLHNIHGDGRLAMRPGGTSWE